MEFNQVTRLRFVFCICLGALAWRPADGASVEHGMTTQTASTPKVIQVYSNLHATGNTYYYIDGWSEVGGNSPPIFGSQIVAMAFTPTVTSVLARIDAALSVEHGPTTALIQIAENNGGIPGNVLSSVSVSGLPKFQTCCSLVQANFLPSDPKVILRSGQTYWIVPSVPVRTYGCWYWNDIGSNGPMAISTDGGVTFAPFNNSPNGAFAVYGIEASDETP